VLGALRHKPLGSRRDHVVVFGDGQWLPLGASVTASGPSHTSPDVGIAWSSHSYLCALLCPLGRSAVDGG
jgi:hypothetical protein